MERQPTCEGVSFAQGAATGLKGRGPTSEAVWDAMVRARCRGQGGGDRIQGSWMRQNLAPLPSETLEGDHGKGAEAVGPVSRETQIKEGPRRKTTGDTWRHALLASSGVTSPPVQGLPF